MSSRAQRSAARLAAVQALYQLETASGDVETIVEEFRRHRLDIDTDPDGEGNKAAVVKADSTLFASIVTETVRHGGDIDSAVRSRLAGDWSLERIDPVLRAVFRAAASELLTADDVPIAVVLSEYTGLVGTYTDEERTIGFANGVLQGLARDLRPAQPAEDTDGEAA